MVSAENSCTPPAIPAPCSKPPTITRMYFVRRLIAVSSSRLGTFRHVDSRHRFILCSCCDGLSRATTLWAKHAGAHRNRTLREQEAKIRACFLIYVSYIHPTKKYDPANRAGRSIFQQNQRHAVLNCSRWTAESDRS